METHETVSRGFAVTRCYGITPDKLKRPRRFLKAKPLWAKPLKMRWLVKDISQNN
jgi:hypothetical protein